LTEILHSHTAARLNWHETVSSEAFSPARTLPHCERLIRSPSGALQKRFQDIQPKRLSGGQIDDEIQLCRLLDWQIAGRRTA
jgi:hypothetical protein